MIYDGVLMGPYGFPFLEELETKGVNFIFGRTDDRSVMWAINEQAPARSLDIESSVELPAWQYSVGTMTHRGKEGGFTVRSTRQWTTRSFRILSSPGLLFMHSLILSDF